MSSESKGNDNGAAPQANADEDRPGAMSVCWSSTVGAVHRALQR